MSMDTILPQTFAGPNPHPFHGKGRTEGGDISGPPLPRQQPAPEWTSPNSHKHPRLGSPKDRPLQEPSYKMCVDLGCHEGARIRSSRHQALDRAEEFRFDHCCFCSFCRGAFITSYVGNHRQRQHARHLRMAFVAVDPNDILDCNAIPNAFHSCCVFSVSRRTGHSMARPRSNLHRRPRRMAIIQPT